MSRKITSPNQLPCNIETHLRPVGEYYIWTDLNEEIAKPSILPIRGNLYYRFLNFLYLPQPPESLSTEQVIEVCDLRLEHLDKLVNYEYNSRIVAAIANYLRSIFPDIHTDYEKATRT